MGGQVEAEYQILRYQGIAADMQALAKIRGCAFDILSGRDLDTNQARKVYFKLGKPRFDDRGECVLQPSASPQQ